MIDIAYHMPTLTKPTRTYTPLDSVFAWLCLLLGYLFCRVFPIHLSPLGGWLLTVGAFAATVTFLLIKLRTLPALAWVAASSALVASGAFLLCDDAFLHHITYLYILAAYVYFIYVASGNTLQRGISNLLPIDVFRAAFIVPFCSSAFLFFAIFSGKAKKSGVLIAKILIGILIAVVPTAIVLGLLSYDDGFMSLLRSIFDFNVWDVFSHTVSVMFGVPIGMYVFAMLTANTEHKGGRILTQEHCCIARNAVRFAPPLTIAAATLPLLAVYVIFFISQWQYYMSGFTGVLPEGFSYAAYAREGFFQLCAVSIINLVMILVALLFTRRRDNRPSWVLRVLTTLYSLSTLILIATAIAKMVMYIDTYGLTQKRVYATWFMLVIAVVFLIITIGQFVKRLKTVFVCAAVCVVMFAALALSNVNGIIADHNVDRYLSGDLQSVDVEALEHLDESAVPALCRLYESYVEDSDNGTAYFRTLRVLKSQAEHLEKRSVWSFTIPRLRAEHALRDVGLM